MDWNPRYLSRRIFQTEEELEYFLAEVCNAGWNRELGHGQTFKEMVIRLCTNYLEYAEEIEAYHLRWAQMPGGRRCVVGASRRRYGYSKS